jgi:hypothetical protein
MEIDMMKPILKIIGIVFAVALFSGLNPAMASDKHAPCQKTALKMFKACNYYKHENLKTTLANCMNLNDRSARQTCQLEARSTSREEAQTCKDRFRARVAACDILGEERYDPDPLQDPTIAFVDPGYVDAGNANPYVSIVEGHTYVLRAGKEGEETIVVHATGDVREIHGIPCRVVVDIVLESEVNEEDGSIEYIPLEVTDDWFAQDVQGNVYYCGELSRNSRDGLLADLDGSFEAGRDFAKAGALIMAYPDIGSAHRQEFALGEAEDIIQYLDLAAYPDRENKQFPCSDNGGCLMTYEYTPLEPEAADFKYYIQGVGFVLAEAMENGELTGERDTLVCVGEDLAVLQQPACGIEDPDELLETLCEVSPEAFCD